MKHTHWVIAFILIALLGAMAGCNPEAKNLRKTQEYLFKHPEFSSGYCAEQFPDKPDSVIVRTDTLIEIATMDSLVYDTLSILHDTTLIRTIVKTQKIYIRKDSIIYRENRAEQERLQLGLLACQNLNNHLLDNYNNQGKQLDEWKKKAKTRWLWIALLIGGAATVAIFKVIKAVRPSV